MKQPPLPGPTPSRFLERVRWGRAPSPPPIATCWEPPPGRPASASSGHKLRCLWMESTKPSSPHAGGWLTCPVRPQGQGTVPSGTRGECLQVRGGQATLRDVLLGNHTHSRETLEGGVPQRSASPGGRGRQRPVLTEQPPPTPPTESRMPSARLPEGLRAPAACRGVGSASPQSTC